jgi:hypothetical protein
LFLVLGIEFCWYEGLVILFNVWSYDMKDAMDTMIVFCSRCNINVNILSFSEYNVLEEVEKVVQTMVVGHRCEWKLGTLAV